MSSTIELPLNSEQIQEIIPHRFPFLFVDEVTEFLDRQRICGKRYVSPEDPFFAGHFPGRPIMPGVLILEALAQLGAIFAKLSTGAQNENRLLVFSGTESVRFRRVVVPGDTLTLEMEFVKERLGHWKMKGTATIDGDKAADGILTATEID